MYPFSLFRNWHSMLFLCCICLFLDDLNPQILYICGSIVLVDLARFFSFLNYTQLVGLTGRRISQSQGRYLHTKQHKQNKRTQTSMSRMRFEPRSQCSSGRR
jgi:hypothetical protein